MILKYRLFTNPSDARRGVDVAGDYLELSAAVCGEARRHADGQGIRFPAQNRQWRRELQHQAVQDGPRGDGGAPDSGEAPPPVRTCAPPRGRQERRAGGGSGYVFVEGQQLGLRSDGDGVGPRKVKRNAVISYPICNLLEDFCN
jgi:hypothetical protein